MAASETEGLVRSVYLGVPDPNPLAPVAIQVVYRDKSDNLRLAYTMQADLAEKTAMDLLTLVAGLRQREAAEKAS